MQLVWFSSELVLASTAVALAPRIMGERLLAALVTQQHFSMLQQLMTVHTHHAMQIRRNCCEIAYQYK